MKWKKNIGDDERGYISESGKSKVYSEGQYVSDEGLGKVVNDWERDEYATFDETKGKWLVEVADKNRGAFNTLKIAKRIAEQWENQTPKDYAKGGEVCTYDYVGYEVNERQCENEGVDYLLTGEYTMVARSLYKTNYNLWLYYNYINRLQITFKDCQEFANQLVKEFTKLPLPISVVKAVGKRKRSYASYKLWQFKPERQYKTDITDDVKGGYIKINDRQVYCKVWTELVCCDESWGAYFLDKNTNRPIPALDRNDYYSVTTLIHELAHCLDFQYQMLYTGKPPVIAHKDYFLKALYKILTACKDGKIKLARSIDLRANLLQKLLNTSEGRKKYYSKPLSKLRLRNMQS